MEQYYLRDRYYNPVVGRFLQEDTYRGDGLNLYAYCANNPVVYYDSSGRSKCDTLRENTPPKMQGNQVVNSDGVEIPWSSKVFSDASDQLDSGARTVTVNNQSQAEELFLGKYQGDGYTNTSTEREDN